MAKSPDSLLDFSQPLDVPLLDAVVNAFYGAGSNEERVAAEKLLRQLQEHPDMWQRVDQILEASSSQSTKFLALQILESVIKYRWLTLPAEQRDGIKNYISNLIIKLSSDEAVYRREHAFLSKLNVVLVEVLKHEWPGRWESFLPDLVGAAKTSEILCENCMNILKLLSEEIFDFSRGEMTQNKIKELKASLNQQFQLVHGLCEYVLQASQKPELIRTTLQTLCTFLSWVPLGYIFESSVVETLLKLFPNPAYRNVALQCLCEIGSLNTGEYFDAQFVQLYQYFFQQLRVVLPPGTAIPSAYENGSDDEQQFINNLALFLTGYLKVHIGLLETTDENRAVLMEGLEYLLGISYVDDTEVFKVCLDYWNVLVCDLFQSDCPLETAPLQGGLHFGGSPAPQAARSRKALYRGPLSKLRLLMITRMAKPEEVLVVEDENGNFVRETMKDSDVLTRYKIMRETLIYLSHLDHEDTERQMLDKLSLHGKEWSYQNLNTLCWAIGSISGSMVEDQENRFLVTVIRDLLNLCELTRGKDSKAVIASNIMYVVGQYPRFLRVHWKFLKTVVNKLFEFMHETHPGVQDMACDTFLKISNKCRRKFVILQVGESEPFVNELLRGLTGTIQLLEAHQVHVFYEAVGLMVGAETETSKREGYLVRLMELPNTRWGEIINQARQSPDMLKQHDVIRHVLNILQSNVSVCTSLGQPFSPQISLIFLDMLNVYRMYSEIVSSSIAEGGPHASKTSFVKLLRSVKKEVLRLIETFVEKVDEQGAALVRSQFVPAMMDPILGDYARNLPDARDAEVLSLYAAIINSLKGTMLDEVPHVFEAVFECTLQMITKNFEDYPDHRLKFFLLLRAVTSHCFRALFQLSPQHLKLVIDSIVWAFRHTERNVAEMGLNLLLELLNAFQASEFANQFYQNYQLTIMQEIFAVLTDTFHKPGFKLHALILQHLFSVVETEAISVPLWDAAALGPAAFPNNADFLKDHTVKLLSSSFPNLSAQQHLAFVQGLADTKNDLAAFKNHLRDFLVSTKQFGDQNNNDLFLDEAAVQAEAARQKMAAIPGMIAPNEVQEDMADA